MRSYQDSFQGSEHTCEIPQICDRQYLKSNEDMILALAGQFKQLSHEKTSRENMSPTN